MSDAVDADVLPRRSPISRVTTIVFDVMLLMILAGIVTVAVVGLASVRLPPELAVPVGFWVAIFAAAAMPVLVFLYHARPRAPLARRSALVASAAAFLKTVWSVFVFVFSILLGAVAGVLAARASDGEEDLAPAIAAAFGSLASLGGPTVIVLAGLAYVWMCGRWISDLNAFRAEGAMTGFVEMIEARWLPESRRFTVRRRARAATVVFHVGRLGLIMSLLVVGFTVWPTAWAAATAV